MKADKVASIQEFRRENVREMEMPDKDFFDYDPETKSKKYDALKFETIFRQQSTMKAIKWGIFVGSLFGMHRYYRTRKMEDAAHWFAVVSCLSSFNWRHGCKTWSVVWLS